MCRTILSCVLLAVAPLGSGIRCACAQQSGNTLTTDEIAAIKAEVEKLREQGRLKDALSLTQQVIASERSRLDPRDIELRHTLGWAHSVARDAGDFDAARTPLVETVALMRRAYPVDHWVVRDAEIALRDWDLMRRLSPEDYARARAARKEIRDAFLVGSQQGKLRQAIRRTQACADEFADTVGIDYSEYATALNNIAGMLRATGDYAQAVPAQSRSIDANRRIFGERHPNFVIAQRNLAQLYLQIKDYRRALEITEDSLPVRKELSPDMHEESLTDLGKIYTAIGKHDLAIEFILAAAQIRIEQHGQDNVRFAAILHALGDAYDKTDEFERSRECYKHSLALTEKHVGKGHPSYRSTLNNLAAAYKRAGMAIEGVALMRKLVEVAEQFEGRDSPSNLTYLHNLGLAYIELGELEAAEPLVRRTLEGRRKFLDDTYGVLSERQQLKLTQSAQMDLSKALVLATHERVDLDWLCGHLLAWKGAVYHRQQLARIAASSPDMKRRLAELGEVNRKLSNLSRQSQAAKSQPNWKSLFREMGIHRQRIEMEIAAGSETFAQLSRSRKVSASTLQDRLPESSVLFDMVEYEHVTTEKEGEKVRWRWERRVAALVIKPGEPIALVQLGPAEKVAELNHAWRTEIARRRGGVAKDENVAKKLPQYQLREILWKPLAPYAEGCQIVLISPDGVLASLPWACLPANIGDRYLIEEYTIVSVPVPRQLLSVDNRIGEQPAISLCLVGGVDFGASPGEFAVTSDASNPLRPRAAARHDGLRFDPLPGTQQELLAIGELFRVNFPKASLAQGVGERATEDRVRLAATKFNHLHFATHGFFLAQDDTPDATSEHPGLNSGIALAGANRGAIDEHSDDGILTALEVASLDLRHVELAVLSACETGLGMVVRGEGVLGLQRAFQMAGAKTALTSLWKVDDEATKVMMVEYYRQLWEQGLGKGDALRQTQLAMLSRYDPRQSKLRPRGLRLIDNDPSPKAADRLPPYYWAAFVLSGDWR